MTLMVDEVWLTTREIAQRLKLTEYTVREWLRTGRLKGYRPGGDRAGWRVRESDLQQFLETTAGPEAPKTE
jgi:excisionase family DNA binding protein